jgi:glycosyltransferase involved in cell wall biosynthesis
MRVLAYAESVEFSGAESAFARIVADLAAQPDLDVVAMAPAGRLAAELRRSCSICELPHPVLPVSLAAIDARLRRAGRHGARRRRYDVVLANLPSAQAGTAGLGLGPPAVGFLHVPQTLTAAGFVLGSVRDRLSRSALRRAARIVVPAPSVRHYVWEDWGFAPERVDWAPPPAAALPAVSRHRARATLGLPADRRLVGILGRVSVKQKGHDVLLRALTRLDPGTDVVIGGTGRDTAAVGALAAELGVAGRVHRLGHLLRPEELYGAVDALAIPSRFEGLPLVALEALRLGVPGIASGVDGLLDVWPREWLVPPADPAALAGGLTAMLAAEPGHLRSRAAARWAELALDYDDRDALRVVAALRAAADRTADPYRPRRTRPLRSHPRRKPSAPSTRGSACRASGSGA